MTLIAPAFLQPALARPVAILGGGVSGAGVRALLQGIGAEGFIYDATPARGSEFTAAAAREHALVVFSPGFAPGHPWLARAHAVGAMCLGELDFASLFWRGLLVAVTGTNGKTTLTEFLTHALRELGREAHATGNIGLPLSQFVARHGAGAGMIAVCEVSSFQAETLQHLRADATLWTNFAEDHLERHPTLEDYFNAKWRLVERTPPVALAQAGGGPPNRGAAPATVFVGSSVRRHAETFSRSLSENIAVIPADDRRVDATLAGTVFAQAPQRENFLLAQAWWRANGLDEAALRTAARTFQIGRHRLARVAEIDRVTYWNDSKATNFHAVEAALARFARPVVLIAGGKSKGGDVAGFVRRIAPRVKHMVLIGEMSAELAFHAAALRVEHTRCGSLAEAVRRAAEVAAPGDDVLLSPGFASFDVFRNYEDRGDQFEKLVQNLGASTASLG